MKPKWIRRKITKTEKLMNPGWEKHWAVGGIYRLTLECGHLNHRKISQGVPKTMMAKCDDCMRLRDGQSGTFYAAGGVLLNQKWNTELQWPVTIEATP